MFFETLPQEFANVAELLIEKGADVNIVNTVNGKTALIEAAIKGKKLSYLLPFNILTKSIDRDRTTEFGKATN